MSQSDLVIQTSGVSGVAFGQDVENGLKALGSTSKGSSAPSTAYAGQMWLDDSGSPWVLKLYDGSDWITLFEVDASGDTATAAGGSAMPYGYLAGMNLSNAADADHDITVSPGACRDAADGASLTLASAMTKQIDATWASGNSAGGLSSSLSAPANDTWYHVFAIEVSGAIDFGFDTSITATNLVTDHSAAAYRRLGSVLTDGNSNIIEFSQLGDEFLWLDPPLDMDSSASTSGANQTISTPPDVKCWAKVNLYNTNSTIDTYVSSPDVNNEAPSNIVAPLGNFTSRQTGPNGPLMIRTNISSQIRQRVTAASGLRIVTVGWVDNRGKG